ncbi:MAG: hypothetical protein AAF533_08825 [Acidobacteriota bacterium]
MDSLNVILGIVASICTVVSFLWGLAKSRGLSAADRRIAELTHQLLEVREALVETGTVQAERAEHEEQRTRIKTALTTHDVLGGKQSFRIGLLTVGLLFAVIATVWVLEVASHSMVSAPGLLAVLAWLLLVAVPAWLLLTGRRKRRQLLAEVKQLLNDTPFSDLEVDRMARWCEEYRWRQWGTGSRHAQLVRRSFFREAAA